jgi:PAS domain S-box-containing protein
VFCSYGTEPCPPVQEHAKKQGVLLEALRESEERYRLLFERSLDAVLLTVPDGSILAANPAACRMFGRSEDEIKQGGRKLLVDESDPRFAVAVKQRNRTGEFVGELILVRGGGATFPGEVSTAVFRNRHGQIRTAMVIRDLSERKRMEQKIQAFSQDILAAREQERKLVSSVLHNDVGSMVVGISANLDAIEADLRSAKPGNALKSVKRTRTLLEDSMARLKALAIELRPPELDVLGLHAALRQHFSRVTKTSGIRIQFREALGPIQVPANAATTLFRIVQEALTNAIAHGHAKQVNVRVDASKEDISLSVHDNGEGFDWSAIGEQDTSRMGLRVMQEMAAFAGGAFSVDSGPGKGTTVRVSLPRRTTAVAPGDITVRRETVARGKTTAPAGRGARARKRSRV